MASPPRRRRTAVSNDSDLVALSSIPSKPSSAAGERPIPATRLVFPPALFDQLVQQVAAEVTRQLLPASSSPAVQVPQGPSPGSAPFLCLTRASAVPKLTTEVPVVIF